jgi:hypothetical protein
MLQPKARKEASDSERECAYYVSNAAWACEWDELPQTISAPAHHLLVTPKASCSREKDNITARRVARLRLQKPHSLCNVLLLWGDCGRELCAVQVVRHQQLRGAEQQMYLPVTERLQPTCHSNAASAA